MKSARVRLIETFLKTVKENYDRPAVIEGGVACTYGEFYSLVYHLYTGVLDQSPISAIGIYSGKSLLSYAGMWASILAGLPYVPLNPSLPSKRLEQIASQSRLDCCICSDESFAKAAAILPGLVKKFICFNRDDAQHRAEDFSTPDSVSNHEIAYILFTSGSTGLPKGVPISYANLLAFVENISNVIDYCNTDRIAQVCETSFDFSVHEIYLALLNGACLFPARNIDLFNPSHYIRSHRLTVWHSVPSLANVALKHGQIDGAFSSIRHSIFNGEPLTLTLLSQWQKAAVNSQHWNFYGPTECTVAVSFQKIIHEERSAHRENNIAIGQFFDNCDMALYINDRVINRADFTMGMSGELLIGGPQTFAGYLDKDVESPFVYDTNGEVFYRSGDIALWNDERLFLLGRLDHQVKIGGYRIELLEIEQQLKAFYETELLAVLALPVNYPEKLVVCSEVELDLSRLKVSDISLPNYMIPSQVVVIDELPRTQNGKIDRNTILSLIGS